LGRHIRNGIAKHKKAIEWLKKSGNGSELKQTRSGIFLH
jgi:hypothetical protein